VRPPAALFLGTAFLVSYFQSIFSRETTSARQTTTGFMVKRGNGYRWQPSKMERMRQMPPRPLRIFSNLLGCVFDQTIRKIGDDRMEGTGACAGEPLEYLGMDNFVWSLPDGEDIDY